MVSQPGTRSIVVQRTSLLTAAWVGTLLTSGLLDIAWREFLHAPPALMIWARVGMLLGLLALAFLWQATAPLRGYWLILLALALMDGVLRPAIAASAAWQGWFGGAGVSWFSGNLGVQLLRLLVTLGAWLALILMGFKRRDYFLTKGQLDAPVEPVRWLGVKEGETWVTFGRALAIVMTAVTLFFLVLGSRPSWGNVAAVLPLLPAVLIFALLNGFNEEFAYRSALLAPLLPIVGQGQALWLAAAYFGLGHYYGIPYGVIGVLMAGLLGWLLGKSMVETRGFFWAWFLHFLQDVPIFFFLAMAAVAAGGG